MKIHHVGYLVPNIKKAVEQFGNFGFSVTTQIVYDASRGTDILFMENNGYRVELIEPKHKDAEMWKQLKKKGAMPYHICYIVENIERKIEVLCKYSGYKVTSSLEEAPAIEGKRVVFLYGEEIGLVELLESTLEK